MYRNSNISCCFENKPYQNVDKHDIADALIHSNWINQRINNLQQHEPCNANCLKEEKFVTITLAAQAPLSGSVTPFDRLLLHLPKADFVLKAHKGEEWVLRHSFSSILHCCKALQGTLHFARINPSVQVS